MQIKTNRDSDQLINCQFLYFLIIFQLVMRILRWGDNVLNRVGGAIFVV
jgi:hypothetical protein